MNCIKCNLEFKNKGGLTNHQNSCRIDESDVINIRKDYDEGLSIRGIQLKYSISKVLVCYIL
jgi:hypothetical protein